MPKKPKTPDRLTKALKLAIKLAATSEDTFPELARCLAEISSEDRSLLGDFLKQSGVKSRKAYYLIELGKCLETLRIADERLRRIGWTKAQIIAAHLMADQSADAKTLLAQAEENTVEGLKALIDGKNPETRAHRMLLNLSPAQYRKLSKAITQNGGRKSGRGFSNKEAVLMTIVDKAAKADLG